MRGITIISLFFIVVILCFCSSCFYMPTDGGDKALVMTPVTPPFFVNIHYPDYAKGRKNKEIIEVLKNHGFKERALNYNNVKGQKNDACIVVSHRPVFFCFGTDISISPCWGTPKFLGYEKETKSISEEIRNRLN